MTRPRPNEPRGDLTRQKILSTATILFAKHGYEGVSTRALAEMAEVNQPAIQYHFGSKEGLYRAVIQMIADDLAERMRGAREGVQTALAVKGQPDSALRPILMELLDAFTSLMLADRGHDAWADFIARAEIENEGLLDGLTKSVWANAVEPCAKLLGRLIDRADDERSILSALALLGTITTFKKRCLQKTISQALGWTSFGPHEIAVVQRVVREQADAFLQAAGKRDAT